MIICTQCKESKDEDCFANDKAKKNGKRSNCIDCKNKSIREYRRCKRKNDRDWVVKTNADLREFHKNNPEKSKQYYKTKTKEQHLRYTLKQNYGITLEYYNELNDKQNGVCAICGFKDIYKDKNGEQSVRRLAVDHCHNTGIVRGLLCGSCNGGLGLFRDDIESLKNAIKYLKVTKEA